MSYSLEWRSWSISGFCSQAGNDCSVSRDACSPLVGWPGEQRTQLKGKERLFICWPIYNHTHAWSQTMARDWKTSLEIQTATTRLPWNGLEELGHPTKARCNVTAPRIWSLVHLYSILHPILAWFSSPADRWRFHPWRPLASGSQPVMTGPSGC